MATTEVETINTGAEKAKLGIAVVLVLAGFVAYYAFARQGTWMQWGGLLACLLAAAVVFLISDSGKRLLAFAQDSVREVKKVVWPERKEAMQMTFYVFAFVFLMAIFLWLTDKTIEWVFYDLILGWRK